MIELWDWRRQVADLYTAIRALDDPRAGWALWCATRNRLFATHAQSPVEAKDRFSGLPVFPYDPALRLAVRLTACAGAPLRLDAGADGDVSAHPFALTQGLASLGGELTLYWLGGYGGGVFLPFSDATSGRETYGGGRYLLDTIKGADLGQTPDGRVMLDFNFAYAPSCAHSPRYVCPLAPVGNRLAAAVRGGERLA
jgi:uncharacterized protein (DUF1684 family)